MSTLDYSKWDNIDSDVESDQENEMHKTLKQSPLHCSIPSHAFVKPEKVEFELDTSTFDVAEQYEKSLWPGGEGADFLRNMMMREQARRMFHFSEAGREEERKNKACAKEKLDSIVENRSEENIEKSFIIRISLAFVSPEIFRVVRVPASYSLAAFQDKVIQPAMGWARNFHGYVFTRDDDHQGYGYGPKDSTFVDNMHRDKRAGHLWLVDSLEVFLFDFFKDSGDTLRYVYDFGDHFTHWITLEEIVEFQEPVVECLDAWGCCPNENCGGLRDWVTLANKLGDPDGLEYFEALTKILHSENYNDSHDSFVSVSECNIPRTNRRLKKLQTKRISRPSRNRQYYSMSPLFFNNSKTVRQNSKEYRDLFGDFGRSVRKCANCGKEKREMSSCAGCGNVFYCDRDCQKKTLGTS